jgi:diguanylate cyclase (GGDEF)-like protein
MGDKLIDFEKSVLNLTNLQKKYINGLQEREDIINEHIAYVEEFIGFVDSSSEEEFLAQRTTKVAKAMDQIYQIKALVDTSFNPIGHIVAEEGEVDKKVIAFLERDEVEIYQAAQSLPNGKIRERLLDFLQEVGEQKEEVKKQEEINQYIEGLLGRLIGLVDILAVLVGQQEGQFQEYLEEDSKKRELNAYIRGTAEKIGDWVERERLEVLEPYSVFLDKKYRPIMKAIDLSKKEVVTWADIQKDLRDLPLQEQENFLLVLRGGSRHVDAISLDKETRDTFEEYDISLRRVQKERAQRDAKKMRTRVAIAERNAITDAATGLYNKGFFRDVYPLIIDQSARYLYMSLLVFDIDKFKPFNDTYGHLIGDDVIEIVADILKENTRKNDRAFRYGGEEFVILFEVGTKHKAAKKVAERIRNAIEKGAQKEIKTNPRLRQVLEDKRHITVSCGVGTIKYELRDNDRKTKINPREEDINSVGKQLFYAADKIALYAAKDAGRNNTQEVIVEFVGAGKEQGKITLGPQKVEITGFGNLLSQLLGGN